MSKKRTPDELEDDIAELFEKGYKTEVAVNTLMSLLMNKGIFNLKEFEGDMKEVRERVRNK